MSDCLVSVFFAIRIHFVSSEFKTFHNERFQMKVAKTFIKLNINGQRIIAMQQELNIVCILVNFEMLDKKQWATFLTHFSYFFCTSRSAARQTFKFMSSKNTPMWQTLNNYFWFFWLIHKLQNFEKGASLIAIRSMLNQYYSSSWTHSALRVMCETCLYPKQAYKTCLFPKEAHETCVHPEQPWNPFLRETLLAMNMRSRDHGILGKCFWRSN